MIKSKHQRKSIINGPISKDRKMKVYNTYEYKFTQQIVDGQGWKVRQKVGHPNKIHINNIDYINLYKNIGIKQNKGDKRDSKGGGVELNS